MAFRIKILSSPNLNNNRINSNKLNNSMQRKILYKESRRHDDEDDTLYDMANDSKNHVTQPQRLQIFLQSKSATIKQKKR